ALYNSWADVPLAFNDADICGLEVRVRETVAKQEIAKIAYQASILPNPAKDRFLVQLHGAAPYAILRVKIMGMNGVVFKETTVQNGQMLPIDGVPGLYFCRIYVGEMLADVVKLVIVP
ncbi:MAG: T9SS type A sorting domain-containing protein, partial [Saprospiraceae bacterium]|nr:T9SS type A sorting domain-containing protein [Saprospiraceae bacterium]